MSPRFLCVTPVVRELSLNLSASEVICLLCVACFCRLLSQWWLFFVLLEVDATLGDGVGFENTCSVSGKWNVSRVALSLYGWVYKILRLANFATVDSIVVVTAVCHSGVSHFESCWWLVSNSRFTKFLLGSSRVIKFVILLEDSDTGGPSSVIVRMEYLFALQFWCCEISVGNQWEGQAGSIIVNFYYLGVLWSSVDDGWWGGTERDRKILLRSPTNC